MTIENKVKSATWDALEKEQRPLTLKELHQLSGLLEADQTRFHAAWPGLPTAVRQQVLHMMVKQAEADFELDFGFPFRIALEDPEPAIRALAIEGLWEDEDIRLVPRLIALLTQDPDSAVRAAAAQTLGHFILLGELKKLLPSIFEKAYQALHTVYHTPTEALEVRRRALEAIAYTDNSAVIAMIEESYQDPEAAMRQSAVFAMGRSADKRWTEIVMHELQSVTPAMRYEATRACGELELRAAVPALTELVEDVAPEVQQMALWALGQIGGREARKLLKRYLNSDDEALRTTAEEALDTLEFYHGDLKSFFGPPAEFESYQDEAEAWRIGPITLDDDDQDEDALLDDLDLDWDDEDDNLDDLLDDEDEDDDDLWYT